MSNQIRSACIALFSVLCFFVVSSAYAEQQWPSDLGCTKEQQLRDVLLWIEQGEEEMDVSGCSVLPATEKPLTTRVVGKVPGYCADDFCEVVIEEAQHLGHKYFVARGWFDDLDPDILLHFAELTSLPIGITCDLYECELQELAPTGEVVTVEAN